MRSLFGAILIALLAGCANLPAPQRIAPLIRPEISCVNPDPGVRAAIVALQTTTGGHGSGIIIGPNLVLTAAHVLGDENTALIHIGTDTSHAELLALESDLDLALLQVSTGGQPIISIAEAEPLVSDTVWALGFPKAQGQRTSRGQFQSIQDGRLYSTADVDNGDSGGGLLQCKNGHYTLAGMISSYLAYRVNGQLIKLRGLSIAVPAARIRSFVTAHSI